MRIILTTLMSALTAALLMTTPASAEEIDKLTVANVGAALTAVGLRWVEAADNNGNPLIRVEATSIDANSFNIFFYACAINGECEDIALWSWYSANGSVVDQSIHQWNDILRDSRNWSRAYVDGDGDPALIMNINATGGIGVYNMQVMINTYVVEARDYRVLVTGQ